MTKEEILAMKPGRELDAKVAEEIFGLRVYRYTYQWCARPTKSSQSAFRLPKYSQTPTAAWQVIEELNKQYGVMLTIFDPSQTMYPMEKVLCEICDPSALDDTVIAQSYSNTAPEAICKTALLAKLGGE